MVDDGSIGRAGRNRIDRNDVLRRRPSNHGDRRWIALVVGDRPDDGARLPGDPRRLSGRHATSPCIPGIGTPRLDFETLLNEWEVWLAGSGRISVRGIRIESLGSQ